MPIEFFSIPATTPADAEDELSRFLRGHRVAAIERHFAVVGGAPMWCLAVECLDSAPPSSSGEAGFRKNRVDYKELLPPEDFARFSERRELRKQIAEAEGLPAYAIFTNEQLAAMAQTCPKTGSELQAIEEVGEAKTKRFGERVLPLIAGFAVTPQTAGTLEAIAAPQA